MIKLFPLLIFLLAGNSVICQTVASSCSALDSITAKYIGDADRLALRKFYQQNLPDTNSIVISQVHADTILRALMAVYNATALPARNAVVSQFKIHTFPDPAMNSIYVAADSNLAWMKKLRSGTVPTGNTQVDNLVSSYYLKVAGYSTFLGLSADHLVIFSSDSNYNIPPLSALFENIQGVSYSEPTGSIGGGNDISANIFPGYTELAYSRGWEDCPSGCIYRHYWKFRVFNDCSVMFLGESGTPLPPPAPTISVNGSQCINKTLTVSIAGATSYSVNGVAVSAPQFTLSSPVAASYLVTAYNGPTWIGMSISISLCTSLNNDDGRSMSYAAYPNPAGAILNVELQDKYAKKKEVLILDACGKIVITGEAPMGGEVFHMDVSALPPGIYFIKIGNVARKFVKE